MQSKLGSNEIQQIKKTIKVLLKKKNLRYVDVAKSLNISLPSVRRLMSSGDLSIEKLVKIASSINLTLFDLIQLSNPTDGGTSYYTEQQEQLFVSYPRAAYIFLMLKIGQSLEEIKKDLKIGDAELNKIVSDLDKLGFIKILQGNRIYLVLQGLITSKPGGIFDKTYNSRFAEIIFRMLYSKSEKKELDNNYELFKAFETYFTEETLKNFNDELNALWLKYRKIANLEYSTQPHRKMIAVSGILAVGKLNTWKRLLWS